MLNGTCASQFAHTGGGGVGKGFLNVLHVLLKNGGEGEKDS